MCQTIKDELCISVASSATYQNSAQSSTDRGGLAWPESSHWMDIGNGNDNATE